MANPKGNCETELASELLHFTSTLDQLDTPTDVLDGLHKITSRSCQLGVLGALLFPARWGDWGGIEKEKTVFLHKSLPEKWWDEYVEMSRKDPAPGAMMARLALSYLWAQLSVLFACRRSSVPMLSVLVRENR